MNNKPPIDLFQSNDLTDTEIRSALAQVSPSDNSAGAGLKRCKNIKQGFREWQHDNREQGPYDIGIDVLNNALGGGFPRKGLGILFAQTSLGKSSLINQIALSYCMTQQSNEAVPVVALFGTENDTYTTYAKMQNCYYRKRKEEDIKAANTNEQKNNFKQAPDLTIKNFEDGTALEDETATAPTYISVFEQETDDKIFMAEYMGCIELSQIKEDIEAFLNEAKQAHKDKIIRPLVIVDLVNHAHPEEAQYDKRLEIDQALLELRRIGMEKEILILGVCSSNRTAFNAPLDCNAIKESGGIENFADLVMGLDVIRREKAKGLDNRYYAEIAGEDEKNYGCRLLQLTIFKNRKGKMFKRVYCGYEPQHDYFDFNHDQTSADKFIASYGKPMRGIERINAS